MSKKRDPESRGEKKARAREKSLREAAEKRLRETPPAGDGGTLLEADRLVHELQVHQIELEMQNEELRRTQQALEESRDRYLDLYEFAPVGYLSLSDDRRILDANFAATALLGLDRQKLVRRPFPQFLAPESLSHWKAFYENIRNSAERQRCELQILKPDGPPLHVGIEAHCQTIPEGKITTRIILVDITERKLAEQRLRIAAIAFESQEGMVVTDAAGVILQVNESFTQMTGYPAEEVIGKTPAVLKSGRHDNAFYQQLWGTLDKDHYWQGEIWNRRKNGKIYAEWLTITAVIDPGGRLTHYVGAFSDITENTEAEAEIHRLAYYDPLTRLPNRRLLLDRLGQALAYSHRNEKHGAILFIDLDHFKTLNDTRGHSTGDLLLMEMASRLQACLRERDTVARLGGDEFVVILEDLSNNEIEAAAQSRMVAQSIEKAIARQVTLGGREYQGSASIGVLLFRGHDVTVEDLLKHADVAMYQAKAAGRNTVRYFDPAMQARLDERSAIEADLHHAVARGQLHLFFQPQIEHNNRVVGVEALLRWEHPERGMVFPDQFIPLAEETGLILSIGRWVLETACAHLKQWEGDPSRRHLRLAVNVSARQFRQADFVSEVKAILKESGINPRQLHIELTESTVIDNIEAAIEKMRDLKAHGIRFAMDDFGTGYSSLSYLRRLPLDDLKIDRSFVSDVITSADAAAIVKVIIGLGDILRLNIIAEGVESEAQRDFLNTNGCRSYQGYLFGRPMPPGTFDQYLRDYPRNPPRSD